LLIPYYKQLQFLGFIWSHGVQGSVSRVKDGSSLLDHLYYPVALIIVGELIYIGCIDSHFVSLLTSVQ
jgi:hypothetical protein